MRILIIEDDRTIATNLYDFLTACGHLVDAAADGFTALRLARPQAFDAIVLDLGLPGIDGMKLCAKLRTEAQVETPVLMLTARDRLKDKLDGFDAGADDYVVKPFALQEVEARLTALHRRALGRTTSKPLCAGELSLDPKTLSVRFASADVKLPPKCIKLLELLLTEPGTVFSRTHLESAVWGDINETSDTLRSHMHILRRTLVECGGYDPIDTVHGLGYRIRADAPPAAR